MFGKNKHKFLLIRNTVLLIFVLWMGIWISWKYYFSEEARVRKSINIAKKACELRDYNLACSTLTEDYHDDIGFNKETMREFLKSLFEKCEDIKIYTEDIEVFFNNSEADVSVIVEYRVKIQEYLSTNILGGSSWEDKTLKVSFRKSDRMWKVSGVSNFSRFFKMQPGDLERMKKN